MKLSKEMISFSQGDALRKASKSYLSLAIAFWAGDLFEALCITDSFPGRAITRSEDFELFLSVINQGPKYANGRSNQL